MGNQSAKGNDQTQYSSDEFKILESSFRVASGHSEKLSKEKLLKTWSPIIDEHLVECTVNFLFKMGKQNVLSITMQRYAEPYYLVERGTIDEKVNFLVNSMEAADPNHLPMKDLENYIASVMKTYLTIQSQIEDGVFSQWTIAGYQSAERTILAFAKGLIRGLIVENASRVNLDKLERWLQTNPTFVLIWREVFEYLYSKHSNRSHHNLGTSTKLIMPQCLEFKMHPNYTPILDIPHVIFVNSNLPAAMRHRWRLLFSSKIMGESFSTMLGKITNKGPTLFIIEDEDRYVFGGYAPESWTLKPTFVGDDSSVLLTMSPAMRCFHATGYNNNFQYLNMNQQTMPNGLGMGGQFNYWGLWIDSEYGLGQSSETCTTYRDYVQLSKRKEFKIRNIEVWGIGDEPTSDEDVESTGRSILDSNLEDKVMLELSGKTLHSEGLRDPDLDL